MAGRVEIHKQSDANATYAEKGAALHLVHRQDRRNRLDCQYELLSRANVGFESVPSTESTVLTEVTLLAEPDGWPLSLRGAASVEADRFCSVITAFSELTSC